MDNAPLTPSQETKPGMSRLEADIRLLIFFVMTASFGYRAITSNKDRGFYLSAFLLFGGFFALAMAAARNPKAAWVNWFFKRRFGARKVPGTEGQA